MLDILCLKSEKGVKVELIVSDSTINTVESKLDFVKLAKSNAEYYITNDSPVNCLVHHKFCIIDDNIIITGSYNWTKKACENRENIIITDDSETINSYNQEFEKVKNHYSSRIYEFNFHKIPTGFEPLDSIFEGGLNPGELVCLSSKANHKITQFVMSIALNLSQRKFGVPIGIISSLDNYNKLSKMLMMMKAEIPCHKTNSNTWEDYEWNQFYDAKGELEDQKIFISDLLPTDTFQKLEGVCNNLRRKNAQFIMIDRLDFLLSSFDENLENDQNRYVLSRLKKLARRLQIPILFSTEMEIPKPKKDFWTSRSNIQNIGIISTYADTVVFLHRPEVFGVLEDQDGNSLKNIVNLIVPKHINGRSDEVYINYDSNIGKFINPKNLQEDFSSNNIVNESRDNANDDDVPF